MPAPFPSFNPAAAGPESPPIHPLESALVGITALHLCFLPWALGAMHAWSQLASLGLAIGGCALAVWPRGGAADPPGESPSVFRPAWRLLCFPVFWAGLALMVYIVVQGLNPAWRFESDARSWRLVPVGHIGWLPAGVAAPFGRSNPWRALVVLGSPWLTACSVWAGFVRRRSCLALFTLLAANAFLLASLGFAERLTGTGRILWACPPSNPGFVASFIYPNHAGAYLNLMVALATGLAWRHSRRVRRRLEGPARAVLFAFAAVLAGILVVFSYSRMSILLLIAFAALIGFLLGVRRLRRREPRRIRWEPVVLAVVLAGIGIAALGTGRVRERFAGTAAAVADRLLVRRAAGEMFRDRWLLGWGAGCFRHGFPLYAQKHPAIYVSGEGGRRFYWEHAHDDLLEFPIELGAAGMLPVAVCLGWLAVRLGRGECRRNPVSLCIAAGGLLLLLHGWVDFVFQNPAVLVTWGVLLVGAVRWAEPGSPAGGGNRIQ